MSCAQRLGGEVPGLGERADPVGRVVLEHDEDAVAFIDDREPSGDGPVAHVRRPPPTVTTTSAPRTVTG